MKRKDTTLKSQQTKSQSEGGMVNEEVPIVKDVLRVIVTGKKLTFINDKLNHLSFS